MTKRKDEALPLPGTQKITGRTRDLWEHLSGRAKHDFPLGARGCDLGAGGWCLIVDGDRYATIAIERDGELYETTTVPTAQPEIVALADRMTVLESEEARAAAKRAEKLAKLGPLEAERELRKGWGQDLIEYLNVGIPDKREKRSAAPDLRPV